MSEYLGVTIKVDDSELKELQKNLDQLNTQFSATFKGLTQEFSSINEQVRELNSTLASTISELNTSFSSLNQQVAVFRDNLQGVEAAVRVFQDIASEISSVLARVEKLGTSFAEFDISNLINAFREVSSASQQMSRTLDDLSSNLNITGKVELIKQSDVDQLRSRANQVVKTFSDLTSAMERSGATLDEMYQKYLIRQPTLTAARDLMKYIEDSIVSVFSKVRTPIPITETATEVLTGHTRALFERAAGDTISHFVVGLREGFFSKVMQAVENIFSKIADLAREILPGIFYDVAPALAEQSFASFDPAVLAEKLQGVVKVLQESIARATGKPLEIDINLLLEKPHVVLTEVLERSREALSQVEASLSKQGAETWRELNTGLERFLQLLRATDLTRAISSLEQITTLFAQIGTGAIEPTASVKYLSQWIKLLDYLSQYVPEARAQLTDLGQSFKQVQREITESGSVSDRTFTQSMQHLIEITRVISAQFHAETRHLVNSLLSLVEEGRAVDISRVFGTELQTTFHNAADQFVTDVTEMEEEIHDLSEALRRGEDVLEAWQQQLGDSLDHLSASRSGVQQYQETIERLRTMIISLLDTATEATIYLRGTQDVLRLVAEGTMRVPENLRVNLSKLLSTFESLDKYGRVVQRTISGIQTIQNVEKGFARAIKQINGFRAALERAITTYATALMKQGLSQEEAFRRASEQGSHLLVTLRDIEDRAERLREASRSIRFRGFADYRELARFAASTQQVIQDLYKLSNLWDLYSKDVDRGAESTSGVVIALSNAGSSLRNFLRALTSSEVDARAVFQELGRVRSQLDHIFEKVKYEGSGAFEDLIPVIHRLRKELSENIQVVPTEGKVSFASSLVDTLTDTLNQIRVLTQQFSEDEAKQFRSLFDTLSKYGLDVSVFSINKSLARMTSRWAAFLKSMFSTSDEATLYAISKGEKMAFEFAKHLENVLSDPKLRRAFSSSIVEPLVQATDLLNQFASPLQKLRFARAIGVDEETISKIREEADAFVLTKHRAAELSDEKRKLGATQDNLGYLTELAIRYLQRESGEFQSLGQHAKKAADSLLSSLRSMNYRLKQDFSSANVFFEVLGDPKPALQFTEAFGKELARFYENALHQISRFSSEVEHSYQQVYKTTPKLRNLYKRLAPTIKSTLSEIVSSIDRASREADWTQLFDSSLVERINQGKAKIIAAFSEISEQFTKLQQRGSRVKSVPLYKAVQALKDEIALVSALASQVRTQLMEGKIGPSHIPVVNQLIQYATDLESALEMVTKPFEYLQTQGLKKIRESQGRYLQTVKELARTFRSQASSIRKDLSQAAKQVAEPIVFGIETALKETVSQLAETGTVSAELKSTLQLLFENFTTEFVRAANRVRHTADLRSILASVINENLRYLPKDTKFTLEHLLGFVSMEYDEFGQRLGSVLAQRLSQIQRTFEKMQVIPQFFLEFNEELFNVVEAGTRKIYRVQPRYLLAVQSLIQQLSSVMSAARAPLSKSARNMLYRMFEGADLDARSVLTLQNRFRKVIETARDLLRKAMSEGLSPSELRALVDLPALLGVNEAEWDDYQRHVVQTLNTIKDNLLSYIQTRERVTSADVKNIMQVITWMDNLRKMFELFSSETGTPPFMRAISEFKPVEVSAISGEIEKSYLTILETLAQQNKRLATSVMAHVLSQYPEMAKVIAQEGTQVLKNILYNQLSFAAKGGMTEFIKAIRSETGIKRVSAEWVARLSDARNELRETYRDAGLLVERMANFLKTLGEVSVSTQKSIEDAIQYSRMQLENYEGTFVSFTSNVARGFKRMFEAARSGSDTSASHIRTLINALEHLITTAQSATLEKGFVESVSKMDKVYETFVNQVKASAEAFSLVTDKLEKYGLKTSIDFDRIADILRKDIVNELSRATQETSKAPEILAEVIVKLHQIRKAAAPLFDIDIARALNVEQIESVLARLRGTVAETQTALDRTTGVERVFHVPTSQVVDSLKFIDELARSLERLAFAFEQIDEETAQWMRRTSTTLRQARESLLQLQTAGAETPAEIYAPVETIVSSLQQVQERVISRFQELKQIVVEPVNQIERMATNLREVQSVLANVNPEVLTLTERVNELSTGLLRATRDFSTSLSRALAKKQPFPQSQATQFLNVVANLSQELREILARLDAIGKEEGFSAPLQAVVGYTEQLATFIERLQHVLLAASSGKVNAEELWRGMMRLVGEATQLRGQRLEAYFNDIIGKVRELNRDTGLLINSFEDFSKASVFKVVAQELTKYGRNIKEGLASASPEMRVLIGLAERLDKSFEELVVTTGGLGRVLEQAYSSLPATGKVMLASVFKAVAESRGGMQQLMQDVREILRKSMRMTSTEIEQELQKFNSVLGRMNKDIERYVSLGKLPFTEKDRFALERLLPAQLHNIIRLIQTLAKMSGELDWISAWGEKLTQTFAVVTRGGETSQEMLSSIISMYAGSIRKFAEASEQMVQVLHRLRNFTGEEIESIVNNFRKLAEGITRSAQMMPRSVGLFRTSLSMRELGNIAANIKLITEAISGLSEISTAATITPKQLTSLHENIQNLASLVQMLFSSFGKRISPDVANVLAALSNSLQVLTRLPELVQHVSVAHDLISNIRDIDKTRFKHVVESLNEVISQFVALAQRAQLVSGQGKAINQFINLVHAFAVSTQALRDLQAINVSDVLDSTVQLNRVITEILQLFERVEVPEGGLNAVRSIVSILVEISQIVSGIDITNIQKLAQISSAFTSILHEQISKWTNLTIPRSAEQAVETFVKVMRALSEAATAQQENIAQRVSKPISDAGSELQKASTKFQSDAKKAQNALTESFFDITGTFSTFTDMFTDTPAIREFDSQLRDSLAQLTAHLRNFANSVRNILGDVADLASLESLGVGVAVSSTLSDLAVDLERLRAEGKLTEEQEDRLRIALNELSSSLLAVAEATGVDIREIDILSQMFANAGDSAYEMLLTLGELYDRVESVMASRALVTMFSQGKQTALELAKQIQVVNEQLSKINIARALGTREARAEFYQFAYELISQLERELPKLRIFSTDPSVMRMVREMEHQMNRLRNTTEGIVSLADRYVMKLRSARDTVLNLIAYQARWYSVHMVLWQFMMQIDNVIFSFGEFDKQARRVLRTLRDINNAMMGLPQQVRVLSAAGDEFARTMRGAMQTAYIQSVKSAMIEAMRAIGASSEELGEILFQLGSAGLKDIEIFNAFIPVLRLMIATEANAEQITKLVAGVYKIWGDSILPAGSQLEKFARIIDVLGAAFRDHQILIKDMIQGLTYAAAGAKLTGLTFEETVASIAVLNDNLLHGSKAGRLFGTMLERLAARVGDFKIAMIGVAERVQKNFEATSDAALRNVDVVGELKAAWESLGEDYRPFDLFLATADVLSKYLEKAQELRAVAGHLHGIGDAALFTNKEVGQLVKILGIQALRPFTILFSSVDKVRDSIVMLKYASFRATEDMSSFMLNSFDRALHRLEGQLRTFFQVLFGHFRRIITLGVHALDGLRNVISGIADLMPSALGIQPDQLYTLFMLITTIQGLSFVTRGRTLLPSLGSFVSELKRVADETPKVVSHLKEFDKAFRSSSSSWAQMQRAFEHVNTLFKDVSLGFMRSGVAARIASRVLEHGVDSINVALNRMDPRHIDLLSIHFTNLQNKLDTIEPSMTSTVKRFSSLLRVASQMTETLRGSTQAAEEWNRIVKEISRATYGVVQVPQVETLVLDRFQALHDLMMNINKQFSQGYSDSRKLFEGIRSELEKSADLLGLSRSQIQNLSGPQLRRAISAFRVLTDAVHKLREGIGDSTRETLRAEHALQRLRDLGLSIPIVFSRGLAQIKDVRLYQRLVSPLRAFAEGFTSAVFPNMRTFIQIINNIKDSLRIAFATGEASVVRFIASVRAASQVGALFGGIFRSALSIVGELALNLAYAFAFEAAFRAIRELMTTWQDAMETAVRTTTSAVTQIGQQLRDVASIYSYLNEAATEYNKLQEIISKGGVPATAQGALITLHNLEQTLHRVRILMGNVGEGSTAAFAKISSIIDSTRKEIVSQSGRLTLESVQRIFTDLTSQLRELSPELRATIVRMFRQVTTSVSQHVYTSIRTVEKAVRETIRALDKEGDRLAAALREIRRGAETMAVIDIGVSFDQETAEKARSQVAMLRIAIESHLSQIAGLFKQVLTGVWREYEMFVLNVENFQPDTLSPMSSAFNTLSLAIKHTNDYMNELAFTQGKVDKSTRELFNNAMRNARTAMDFLREESPRQFRLFLAHLMDMSSNILAVARKAAEAAGVDIIEMLTLEFLKLAEHIDPRVIEQYASAFAKARTPMERVQILLALLAEENKRAREETAKMRVELSDLMSKFHRLSDEIRDHSIYLRRAITLWKEWGVVIEDDAVWLDDFSRSFDFTRLTQGFLSVAGGAWAGQMERNLSSALSPLREIPETIAQTFLDKVGNLPNQLQPGVTRIEYMWNRMNSTILTTSTRITQAQTLLVSSVSALRDRLSKVSEYYHDIEMKVREVQSRMKEAGEESREWKESVDELRSRIRDIRGQWDEIRNVLKEDIRNALQEAVELVKYFADTVKEAASAQAQIAANIRALRESPQFTRTWISQLNQMVNAVKSGLDKFREPTYALADSIGELQRVVSRLNVQAFARRFASIQRLAQFDPRVAVQKAAELSNNVQQYISELHSNLIQAFQTTFQNVESQFDLTWKETAQRMRDDFNRGIQSLTVSTRIALDKLQALSSIYEEIFSFKWGISPQDAQRALVAMREFGSELWKLPPRLRELVQRVTPVSGEIQKDLEVLYKRQYEIELERDKIQRRLAEERDKFERQLAEERHRHLLELQSRVAQEFTDLIRQIQDQAVWGKPEQIEALIRGTRFETPQLISQLEAFASAQRSASELLQSMNEWVKGVKEAAESELQKAEDTVNELTQIKASVDLISTKLDKTFTSFDQAMSRFEKGFGTLSDVAEALGDIVKVSGELAIPAKAMENLKVNAQQFNEAIVALNETTRKNVEDISDIVVALDERSYEIVQSFTKVRLAVEQFGSALQDVARRMMEASGHQKGGLIPGYGGGDIVHALLEPGEFVIRKEAVAAYGPSLLQSINEQRFHFKVPEPQPLRPLTINLGGEVLQTYAREDTLQSLMRKLRRKRLVRGNF